MEEITIYKAVDGTRFDSKYDCEYYESVIDNDKQSNKILEYLYDGFIKSDEQFKSRFITAIAWLEKQCNQKKQVHFPKFTFDDVLALQLCMETVKKVQEDKELYEKLNLIHSKVYDAYWIEKKGEQTNECAKNKQKSTDKIEPRFKVGDWLCANELNNYANIIKIFKIVDVFGKKRYKISRDYDSDLDLTEFDFIEKYYHIWTIQDAKDGDVLVHSSFMFDDFIFIYNNTSIIQSYCYYSNERNRFIIEDRGHHCPWNMQEVTPATKEQRDFLFQKMKESGYGWDAEKKELKKLVPNIFDPKTLQPFDKVLVKISNESFNTWYVDFVAEPSHVENEAPLILGEKEANMVIPYNEETKHLVGTTDEAPEYYRYWEE